MSRKPLAKEFRKWVSGVLEEIRKTGEYKLNKQIEYKTKNEMFIGQYQNKPVFYIGMVESSEILQIVKYGYTQDTKSTLKRHQDTYGPDFHYVFVLECKEHYQLENKIQNHNDLTSRHIKKYNDAPRQELLRLDDNFTLKDLFNLVLKMSESMESDKELRITEIELRKTEMTEKTKQEEQKTEQMRIKLEMMKMELQLSRELPQQIQEIQVTQQEIPQQIQQELPQQIQVTQQEKHILTTSKGSKILLLTIMKNTPGNHLHMATGGYHNYNGYTKEFKDSVELDVKNKFGLTANKRSGKIYYLGIRLTDHTSFYNMSVYRRFVDKYIEIPEESIRFDKIPPGTYKYKVCYEELIKMFYETTVEIPLFEPKCHTGFTFLFKQEFVEMICKFCNVKPPSYTNKTIKYFNGITLKTV